MELSDGTWKEIERVEKHHNHHLNDFLQKEREFALEELPRAGGAAVDVKIDSTPSTNNVACKEITECVNNQEPSNTNDAINNQTNGNAIPKNEKVCFNLFYFIF